MKFHISITGFILFFVTACTQEGRETVLHDNESLTASIELISENKLTFSIHNDSSSDKSIVAPGSSQGDYARIIIICDNKNPSYVIRHSSETYTHNIPIIVTIKHGDVIKESIDYRHGWSYGEVKDPQWMRFMILPTMTDKGMWTSPVSSDWIYIGKK